MIFDVTLGIAPEMLAWPGDPPVIVEPASRVAAGGDSNVSELRLGTHTGTHVDPPCHFIEGGLTIDRLPLDVLVGEAMVVDARGMRGALGPAELDSLSLTPGVERLLLKTDNSALWRQAPPVFPSEYVSLSLEGAAWLVERGVRLVGTDFLSIEAFDAPGHPVHRTLLEAGVVIVEGLDLFDVEPGRYTLACLPLKLMGGDGAPARTILLRD